MIIARASKSFLASLCSTWSCLPLSSIQRLYQDRALQDECGMSLAINNDTKNLNYTVTANYR